MPLFFGAFLAPVPLAHAGTAFGHPMGLVLSPGADVTYTSATLPVLDLELEDCTGATTTVSVDATLEPLEGDEVELPDGTWCALSLVLDGPLTVQGTGGGGTFTLELDLGTIDVVPDESFAIEGGSPGVAELWLGDTDWVGVSLLELGVGLHVTVDAGDALHDVLVDSVQSGSTVN